LRVSVEICTFNSFKRNDYPYNMRVPDRIAVSLAFLAASLCFLSVPCEPASAKIKPVGKEAVKSVGKVAAKPVSGNAVTVFKNKSDNNVPYRIPAIVQNRNGDLLAVADYRYCKSDIGYGLIDLRFSISGDLGDTWSAPETLIAGDESKDGTWEYAFGDPCLAADTDSDEVLCISCAGHVPYWSSTRDNSQDVSVHRSHDGGRSWTEHKSITEDIYALFDDNPSLGRAEGLFFSSGRMCQSSKIKEGRYFRLYMAIPVRREGSGSGVYCLYSDDFGESWSIMGEDGPVSATADEAKCVELPDGSVLVSIRKSGARGFNLYKDGRWDKDADAPAMKGVNACNGAIVCVPAVRVIDGKKVELLLQTLPFSGSREDVGVFYAELPSELSSKSIAGAFKKGMQLSEETGAYSDMAVLRDGTIAVLYENDFFDGGYDILYRRCSVSELTLGEYK
jgi:sialidase-1